MKTVHEVRYENLVTLVNKHPHKLAGLAKEAGVSEPYLRQLWSKQPSSRNGEPRAIGASLARKMEVGLHLPRGWMDAPQGEQARDSKPLEQQLLTLFRRLSPASQDKVLLDANHLYNLENPEASVANPFALMRAPTG